MKRSAVAALLVITSLLGLSAAASPAGSVQAGEGGHHWCC
jgi:hypothetical protein